jgi:NAD(P)-dependent dehydrogenase (short-subunit alcohol dehydrogenase family)
LVVGAGQQPGVTMGNGHAIATVFAREGAEVACVDVVPERAESTAAELRDQGAVAHVIVADVGVAADCARLVAEAHTAMGGIDALVNVVALNPGVQGHFLTCDEATWQQTMDVNLRSMWLVTRAVVPIMRAQGGGAITNISSVTSLQGSAGLVYPISKAAVNSLTHHTAEQFAPDGIRCNAVLPGFVATPRSVEGRFLEGGRTVEEVKAQRAALVPLGRVGDAWDIAHAVLYLSSDEAGFVTAQLLTVDGGLSSVVGSYANLPPGG